MRGLLFTSLCLCLLSGCMVGPNYRAPNPDIPDEWGGGNVEEAVLLDPPPTTWWEGFHDPLLSQYVTCAAHYNNEVQVAEARIMEARAIRQIVSSRLFPQLDGGFDASRTYFSKNGPLFAGALASMGNAPGLPFQIDIPRVENIFTTLFDASWEIDLFGKIRRGVEAARAHIGSALEQKHGVVLSVMAETAAHYIALRRAQQAGLLVAANISLLEEKASLYYDRWQKGLTDQLDYQNVEAELADFRSRLPPLYTSIYQNIYALSVLTGLLPEALLEELSPIGPLPTPPESLSCGLRSDLLRRRPDIRQAERDLAASTALIGVAVANFFPSLTLGADLGLQALALQKLFQLRSNTWALAGAATIPLFHGGRLIGDLRLSTAHMVARAYTYQQTVLTALQEAEGALVAYGEDEKVVKDLGKAVESDTIYDALTVQRYQTGLVSLIDTLESGRKANTAKLNLLEGETALLVDLVSLYKALGGGWEWSDECSGVGN